MPALDLRELSPANGVRSVASGESWAFDTGRVRSRFCHFSHEARYKLRLGRRKRHGKGFEFVFCPATGFVDTRSGKRCGLAQMQPWRHCCDVKLDGRWCEL